MTTIFTEDWVSTLHAINDDAAKLIARQRKTIHELIDLLGRCAEFIEPYADVVDGAYGEPEPNELRALSQPSFDLSAHLARSAEVEAFDLSAWMRPRQTVNVVRSTCAKLRRPI